MSQRSHIKSPTHSRQTLSASGLTKVLLWIALLTSAFTFTMVGDVQHLSAQESPPRREGAEDKEVERRATLKKVQAARALRLREVLDLTDAKLEDVDKRLRRLDEKIFKVHRAHRKTRRKLRKAMKNGASDAELEGLLAKLVDQRRRLDDLRLKQFEEGAKPLPVRKRVKLFQFLPQFERKARRHLKRERKKGKRRGGKRGRNRRHNRD